MKSFLIKDGDICFDSDKKIRMTDGKDEEAQAVERLLTTNVTEWFLNALHGLEYDKIRGKQISVESIQMAILKACAQEKRVREVISIDISRNNQRRTVDITVVCQMVSGSTVTWSKGGVYYA